MPIPNNSNKPAGQSGGMKGGGVPEKMTSMPSKAHTYTPAPGSMQGDWSCSYPEGGRTGHIMNPHAFTDGSKTGPHSTKY